MKVLTRYLDHDRNLPSKWRHDSNATLHEDRTKSYELKFKKCKLTSMFSSTLFHVHDLTIYSDNFMNLEAIKYWSWVCADSPVCLQCGWTSTIVFISWNSSYCQKLAYVIALNIITANSFQNFEIVLWWNNVFTSTSP